MTTNQIKLGVIVSYIGLFVNILIGLIYTPWMIQTIGSSDFGLYTLAMSIIGLLSFDFGLGNATTRFMSKYLAEGKQHKIDNLLGLIYKLYFVIDGLLLFVLLVIYLGIPNIYSGLSTEELDKFKTLFLIAAVFCVISFPFIPLNGILTSYEKFVSLKLCDLLHKLTIVIVMLICLLKGGSIITLVIVNALAGLFVIALKLYVIKKSTPIKVNFGYRDSADLKSLFSFTLWVTVVALSQRLIFNISPSLLGALSDSTSIAILGVAITLEGYVYLFANALNGMFMPRVSRMINKNDSNAILKLMIKIGRIQIFIIGFIIIWLIAFGNHFISIWIGDDYSLVYTCCLLLILPSFLHLPQEVGLTYIVALNKVKLQALVYIMMGVLNIILSIPLTIIWGVQGMCMSIFIAYIVRTIGLDLIFKRNLHLDIKRFFIDSYIKLLIPMVIIMIISIALNRIIPISGWIGLIIKSGFYAILFFIICLTTGFNHYEKSIIFSPISQFIKMVSR